MNHKLSLYTNAFSCFDKGLNSYGHRFHFNGKEGDDEMKGEGNSYDFGARIYDPKLGRWNSIDAKAIKYPAISPFVYAANIPILFIDPNGKEVYIYGEDAQKTVCALQTTTTLILTYNTKTNQLTAMGEPKNEYDRALLDAIANPNVKVNLYTTDCAGYMSKDGTGPWPISIGGYEGSEVRVDDKSKAEAVKKYVSGDLKGANEHVPEMIVETTQIFNQIQAKSLEDNGGENAGRAAGHEILESYYGGVLSPGGNFRNSYDKAHKAALSVDPIAASNPDESFQNATRGFVEVGWKIQKTNTKVLFSRDYELKGDNVLKANPNQKR